MFPHYSYVYATIAGCTDKNNVVYTSYWISRGFFFLSFLIPSVYVIYEGVRCEVNKKKKKTTYTCGPSYCVGL